MAINFSTTTTALQNSSGNNIAGGTCSSIVTGTPNTRLRWQVSVTNNSVITGSDTNAQTTAFTIAKVAGI